MVSSDDALTTSTFPIDVAGSNAGDLADPRRRAAGEHHDATPTGVVAGRSLDERLSESDERVPVW